MKQTYTVQGMTCSGCASTVEKALSKVTGIQSVTVRLEAAAADITAERAVPFSQLQEALRPWPNYLISEAGKTHAPLAPVSFWQDAPVWRRAGLNTLNCLIGCSIGDFMMVIFLQAYYPNTSMALQMVLATTAGLMTSVAMETVLLRIRESFAWALAFQTAVSMSFISMIAMELVMNTTDFMITGGKASFGNPMYWTALIVAMVAGFLAPLPYNYYKLKKYNKACH
jgi:copper chaperone CopZ